MVPSSSFIFPNNYNRGGMVVDGNVGVKKIAHAGELITLPFKDDMIRILKCQICSKIPVPPIYVCVTGHSICSSCNSRVSNCRRCNGRLNGVRNYSLEGIINASTFTCKYGCRDIIKGENMIKHSADCNFQPSPEFRAAQQELQRQSEPYITFPSTDTDSSNEEMNLPGAVDTPDIFLGYLRRCGPPRTCTTMTRLPPPQPNANAATTSQPMRQTARMSTGPRPVADVAGTNATASASRERRTLTPRRRSTTRPRQAMGVSTPRPRSRGRPSQSTTTGVPPTAAEQRAASSTASSTRTIRGSTPPAHRTRSRMAISISSSET